MTDNETPQKAGQPTAEEIHIAYAENRYRTAARLLIDSGVILRESVDETSLREAAARDAVEELERINVESVDPEAMAKVEYVTARPQLEATFDRIRMGEQVAVPHVGSTAALAEFASNPAIINMFQLRNRRTGNLNTWLVETLADDGSRILGVRHLSNSSPGTDQWTDGDYTVGLTEGEVREVHFRRNADGRMVAEPPTVRNLTGEDVVDLSTRLGDYQLVEGGLLHRELPDS